MARPGKSRRVARSAGRSARGPAGGEGPSSRPTGAEARRPDVGEPTGAPDGAPARAADRATRAAGRAVAGQPPSAIEAFLDRWFVPLGLGIVLIAAALRLPELALNPFHHDEGVNGFFTTRLVRLNTYAYDPANYHGPSLYYFALLSAILFGLNDVAMRLVPVAAGLATVALVLPLRAFLGSLVALTAALLLAVSPGMVYVSRYFIHEALLVCFTLGLIASILLYAERRNPAFLLMAAASAALIFATKETGIITVVVLVIAAVVADRYVELRHPGRARRAFVGGSRQAGVPAGRAAPRSIWVDGVEYRPAADGLAASTEGSGRGRAVRGTRRAGPATASGGARDGGMSGVLTWPAPTQLLAAAIIFLVVWILLFSSFFRNYPKGLVDSLATFMIWTRTSGETQTQPFTRYLEWMAQADAPLLLLGLAGGLLVAYRASDRLTVFIGLWALGLTLAYSLIPYKTPWIVVNMLLPLALLAGILLRELWSRAARSAVPLVLGSAVALSTYQAVDLNYVNYDTEKYGYVFVHTTREAFDLVGEINDRATQSGQGREVGVVMYSPDYWPLPWYLRDFTHVGYHGRIVPTEEPIVIVNANQEAELDADFTSSYAKQGQYTLRPGVELVVYLRRSTFGL